MTLGVSTTGCFLIVQSCLQVLIGSQVAVYIDADNNYVCLRLHHVDPSDGPISV